ncbi:hypothetical protein LINGRAHAP2_LOCUS30646 [Linum grandiflorum]
MSILGSAWTEPFRTALGVPFLTVPLSSMNQRSGLITAQFISTRRALVLKGTSLFRFDAQWLSKNTCAKIVTRN